MGFTVYIIESVTTGGLYVGQTSDLARRLKEHNDPSHKPGKYTSRQQGPWELVYSEGFDNQSEAMKREKYIKAQKSTRWIREYLIDSASPD